MEELFKKRRLAFQARCLKYLRYVFNDHFVLVLFFLLGFLLYQYKQLLEQFPKETWVVWLVLVFLIVGLLSLGRLATHLLPADQHYLLTQEREVVREVQKATVRSFILWGTLQIISLILLFPIFKALGVSLVVFAVLVAILFIVKGYLYRMKYRYLISGDRLNWSIAIDKEKERQQAILKFFALFTNVKGISTSVKRRAYLDVITRWLSKTSHQTWGNLYLRAFLRSGDYLGLFLRLGILAIGSLIFVQVPWLNVGLAFIFNYLLGFQLLALYHHYDYQFFTQLFPVGSQLKKANLLHFLRCVLYILTVLEIVLSGSLMNAGVLVVLNLILVEGYLRYKTEKMID